MRERTDDEIREQGFAMLGIDVRTSSEVRVLLKKMESGPNILRTSVVVKNRGYAGQQESIWLTNFWAEKMHDRDIRV